MKMDEELYNPMGQSPDKPSIDISNEYQLLIQEMTTAFAFHQMIYDENGKPLDYIFLAVNKKFEELTGLDSGQLI